EGGPLDAQPIQQRAKVLDGERDREGLPDRLGLAVPSQVPRQHLVPAGRCGDLGLEGTVVEAEPVRKDHNRRVCRAAGPVVDRAALPLENLTAEIRVQRLLAWATGANHASRVGGGEPGGFMDPKQTKALVEQLARKCVADAM